MELKKKKLKKRCSRMRTFVINTAVAKQLAASGIANYND